jgi:hypothetical protein
MDLDGLLINLRERLVNVIELAVFYERVYPKYSELRL